MPDVHINWKSGHRLTYWTDCGQTKEQINRRTQAKEALNALGFPVSRNKARKLMREANVKARQRKKFKVTTNSNHKLAWESGWQWNQQHLPGRSPDITDAIIATIAWLLPWFYPALSKQETAAISGRGL